MIDSTARLGDVYPDDKGFDPPSLSPRKPPSLHSVTTEQI